jgi:hypothetical protein
MAGISATGALLAAGLHAAAGGSGLSRDVAGTGPVFLAFLAIHIPAGLAAVISGAQMIEPLTGARPSEATIPLADGVLHAYCLGCLRDPESRAADPGSSSRKSVAVDHRSAPQINRPITRYPAKRTRTGIDGSPPRAHEVANTESAHSGSVMVTG